MDALNPKPTLALIAVLALAACSHTDVTPVALAAASSPRSESATPVYPPLQADAQDGRVFEYY